MNQMVLILLLVIPSISWAQDGPGTKNTPWSKPASGSSAPSNNGGEGTANQNRVSTSVVQSQKVENQIITYSVVPRHDVDDLDPRIVPWTKNMLDQYYVAYQNEIGSITEQQFEEQYRLLENPPK